MFNSVDWSLARCAKRFAAAASLVVAVTTTMVTANAAPSGPARSPDPVSPATQHYFDDVVLVVITAKGGEVKVRNDLLEQFVNARVVAMLDGTGRVRGEMRAPGLAQRVGFLRALVSSLADGPSELPRLNLPEVLQTADDWSRLTGAAVDLVILGDLAHADSRFDFRDGYPNDGFILLGDSGFRNLARRDGVKPFRVHVVHPRSMKFPGRYERWMDLLLAQRVGATLITFDAEGRVGQRFTPKGLAADRGITTSRVVASEPAVSACPELAVPIHWTASEATDYWVNLTSAPDACMANTTVQLSLNGLVTPFKADSSGVVRARMHLRAGDNSAEVPAASSAAGSPTVIYQRSLPARPDDIRVELKPRTEVADQSGGSETQSARLIGTNSLREAGSAVAIVHRESGRPYRAVVDGAGAWSANVLVPGGFATFAVDQMGSLPPAVVKVGERVDCDDKVTTSVREGIASLVVANRCRRGGKIQFSYGGADFERLFDSGGTARLRLPLASDRGVHDIWFDRQDGSRRFVTVNWTESGLTRVTLSWDAPVDLDLHVFEPGASAEGADPGGHVFFGHMSGHVGKLDVDDQGEHLGKKIEHYTTRTASVAALRRGALEVRVDFYSRYGGGTSPQPPYCGGGQFDNVSFDVQLERGGSVERLSLVMPSVPCEQGDGVRRTVHVPFRGLDR